MGVSLQALRRRLSLRYRRSLFFRNFAMLSLLLIVPMGVVGLVVNLAMSEHARMEIDGYGDRAIRAMRVSMEAVVSECRAQMNMLLNDANVSLFVTQKEPGPPVLYDFRYISGTLKTQMTGKDYLTGIYLYSESSSMLLSDMGLFLAEGFHDMNWRAEYEAGRENAYYWMAMREATNKSLYRYQCLSLYKTCAFTGTTDGVLVYNLHWGSLTRKLQDLRGDWDAGLCLVDPGGNVFDVWGKAAEYLPTASEEWPEAGAWRQTGSVVLYGESVLNTGWRLVSAVSAEMYRKAGRAGSFFTSMTLIALIGFIAAMVLALLFSRRMNRPFRAIAALLGQVAPLDDAVTCGEEQLILNSVRNMVRRNEELARELEARVTLLKRAQSDALQAQINPHALHNTLDSINWAAMRLTGGKNEASEMISLLAATLRYAFESNELLVSLRQELEQTRQYLQLQQMRYRDKLNVRWDVDETLNECPIIRLILQPLVENAFFHGIRPKRTGTIGVRAWRDGEIFHVEVSDDGVGMSEAALVRLRAALREGKASLEDGRRAHIGLLNVNRRVRLYLGDERGVEIFSREGEGTRVVVSLPTA